MMHASTENFGVSSSWPSATWNPGATLRGKTPASTPFDGAAAIRRRRISRIGAWASALILIVASALAYSNLVSSLTHPAQGSANPTAGSGVNPGSGVGSNSGHNRGSSGASTSHLWLPHRVSRETSPEESYQVQIQLPGIDLRLPWTVIVHETVTLTWAPGPNGVRPEIALDDAIVAHGEIVPLGGPQAIDLAFSATAGSHRIDPHRAVVSADPTIRVVLVFHGRDPYPSWVSRALASPSTFRGEVPPGVDELFVAGALYWTAVDNENVRLAEDLGVSVARRPSLAIVTGGPAGTGIDVVLDSLAVRGPLVERWRFMALSGIASSLLEFATLETITGQMAVDTLRVLAEASRLGIPLATIESADQIARLEEVSGVEEVALRAAVESRYTILIPVRPVTFGELSVRAWFVVDPRTGSTGAYLSDHNVLTRGGFSDAVGAIGQGLTTVG